MDDYFKMSRVSPEGFTGWIIVMGLRVLLIIYHLIREILVEAILDVYIKV